VTTPDAAERALLARYRPRLMFPEDHPGPIDFYRDYVAAGELFDGNGTLVSRAVTRDMINAYKSDPYAVFRHSPENLNTSTPVIYGRIDRDTVEFEVDGQISQVPFIFLTYHAVFRHSGLPSGLAAWKALLVGLVGDLHDWHQLDHYTAVTLVLDEWRTPVAVMLQQHNYQHTYLIGEGVDLPADGRLLVDVAIRSNELYPHVPGRQVRRAVRFATPDGMAYLLRFGDQPVLAADDVTHSVREADYLLGYLPPNDAFYVFQGFLGERRLLSGRSGPPGAAYNTLPALKPLGLQMLAGYWRAANAGDWKRYRKAAEAGRGEVGFAKAQSPVFHANWQCLRRKPRGCRLH
jgi:hypothetical protein